MFVDVDLQRAYKQEYDQLDEAVKTFVDDCRTKLVGGNLSLTDLKTVTNLKGIHLVGEITELTIKNCPNFHLDGIEKLNTLTKLTVNNCEISDLSPISNIQLEYLDLSGNRITRIEELELMLPLRDLDLSNNNIDWQELLYLSSLFNIKRLNICGNPCCDYEEVVECILFSMINPESKVVEAEQIWYATDDKTKNDLLEIKWKVDMVNVSLPPYPTEMIENWITKQAEKLMPHLAQREKMMKDETNRLRTIEQRLTDGVQEVQDGIQNIVPHDDSKLIQ